MLIIKKLISLALILLTVSIPALPVYASDTISKDDALLEIFGPNYSFSTETVRLQGGMLDRIMERLGGKLVYEQIGSESQTVAEHRNIDFHFAMQNGQKIGVAIVDVQPGKWGPVEFMTGMLLDGPLPRVKRVVVMSMQEKRGRPIARVIFMKQFVGKTAGDPLEAGNDIVAVSGATISSNAASFSVKKALVLVEECILNKAD